jgi:tryptophanyl-tRNA synthetase
MNENGEIDSDERKNAKDNGGDVVTPWSVTSSSAAGVDYDKLLGELAGTLFIMNGKCAVRFGCSKLQDSLVERIARLTNKPAHHLLRRGMFFAHRLVCSQ